MGKTKRGQVAVELFALIAALVLIFLVITVIERDRDTMIYTQRVQMDGKRVSELVSTEINTAVIVGNGYTHRFSIPEFLASTTPYSIHVDGMHQYVEISWEGDSYLMPIITSNASATFKTGWNTITNQNGNITITG